MRGAPDPERRWPPRPVRVLIICGVTAATTGPTTSPGNLRTECYPMTPEAPSPRPPAVQSPLTLSCASRTRKRAIISRRCCTVFRRAPPDKNPIWRALDKLKTAHFARFVFLEQDEAGGDHDLRWLVRRLHQRIHRRDRRRVQRRASAHGRGAPCPVQQHRQAFLDYVRANDLRGLEPFYSAYPTATVVTIMAALEDQA